MAGIFGPDRARPELAKKIPPRPFPSLRLKSAAGFLTMAVLSQTPGWEGGGGGGWKRIQLNSRIYAGINYSGGRKDPGRYHAAATTILTAPPLPPLSTTTATIDLLLSLVFFQPDFSVSLRTGMQFTELFLNPSGGTTAKQEESAPERKKK